MSEQSMNTANLDPMVINIAIGPQPLKNLEHVTVNREAIENQALAARESIVSVDFKAVRGTCSDERERVGLLSGESKVEARPAVWGGPNIYGLYMTELTGY